MNRRLSITLRIVAIVAIAACLWWFVRAMDFAQLGHDLRAAKLWPLIVAHALFDFVGLARFVDPE